jgi:hypothetical protein
MTEEYLKETLFAWLQGIIPGLWVGTGGTRPANVTEFVWHMEPGSRPLTPLLECRLTSDTRIGRDYPSAPDAAKGSQIYTGVRDIMLYLNYMGEGAMTALKAIRNATHDRTKITYLQDRGIAFREAHPIVDAHVFLGTMPEDRAIMDMRFGFTDNWSTVAGIPGIIETVNSTGKIDSVENIVMDVTAS